MVRKALVTLSFAVLGSTALAQEPELDPMDNVVWQFQSVTNSTYWVVARDVTYEQSRDRVTVWMNGDHYADSTVKYRKSLSRITLDCEGSMRTSAVSTFAPDGRAISHWDGYGQSQHIRPDSLGSHLEKQFCGKK